MKSVISNGLSQLQRKCLDAFSFFKPKTVEMQYNDAVDLYQAGKYKEAIHKLSKIQAKGANFLALYYTKGLCYQGIGDDQLAKESYKSALALNPDDPDTLYNLARLYYNENDLETALAYAEQAQDITKDNGDELVEYLLGLIYEQQNRTEDAILAYERSLTINPKQLLAAIFLGKLCMKIQDFPKAIAILKDAVEQDPLNLEVNYDLALCLAKVGEWEDTIRYCKRVIEIDPGYAKAYNQLGLALYCTERLEEAVESYQTALRTDPCFSTALNNLAYTYEKMQNYEKAIEAFTEYLALKENQTSEPMPIEERMQVEEHITILKRKLLE